MENVYKIQLRPSGSISIAPLFRAVQGDKGTRKIEASIYNDDGTVFQNESGITATYTSKKPDGNGTSHSATISASASEFKVVVTLTEQDLACDGKVYATIVLKKSSVVLAAMPFYFWVAPIPMGNDVESTSDYQTMQEATAATEQATADAIEATEAAEQATEYATEAADTASNYNIDLLAEGYDATAIYIKGDYCIYDGALYRCLTDILTPEAWTASHWVAVELGADVEDAWKDATEGYSDTLTAGDLTSDEYQTDDEPYLFRRTYGGANNHAMDTLVGGTVAWNQLYNTHTTYQVQSGDITGLTITVEDGFIDISGTASANALINVFPRTAYIPANHVCLILCDGWNGFRWQRAGFRVGQQSYYMNKHDMDFMGNVRISIESGSAYSIHARFSTFDLTQMFGSTIADAVYAMEQAESGSGVAWFRRYFPEDYYAYDSGTLKSVEAVAHRMTGKNMFPRPYAQKGNTNLGINYTIQDDGTIIANGTASGGNANLILIDNTAYDFKHPIVVDGCPNGGSSSTYRIFVIPEQGASTQYDTGNGVTIQQGTIYRYVIVIYSGYTANNLVFKPMIRYADTSDTFEPHKHHTYKLDSSLTLRGIPKLTDGKLQYDGDTYEPSGQVVRRYGVVDLGTLAWAKMNDTENFFTATFTPVSLGSNSNLICARYTAVNELPITSTADKVIRILNGNSFRVHDTAYTDAATFKASLSGVYVVYILATPTTESASPYEPTQVVYTDGTEEYISQNIVPVGHVTKYPVSIKQALTQIAKAPSANGTYILKCVVTDGVASYSWVTE